jgi:hypothetical protein
MEGSPDVITSAAEYELGKEGTRWKMFSRVATFWYGILQMEQEEVLKCYDWQIGNQKNESWAS